MNMNKKFQDDPRFADKDKLRLNYIISNLFKYKGHKHTTKVNYNLN